MRTQMMVRLLLVTLIAATVAMPAMAQSTAVLQGTVTDASGAVVPNAKITASNLGTGLERTSQSDSSGNYVIASLPVGRYRMEVQVPGMATVVVNDVLLEVGRTTVQNAQLKVAHASEEVTVSAESPVVESSTMAVSQVVDQRTVQDIPLNGRHFVDLGLLIPGSVTPPQSGFLTAPLRGQGSFAFNTAGQREDTVNFMINGVNLNDQVQNQITFQPSISTVQEFKVDNSTFSAEQGRSSGAIVNIATRSGTNEWHGELFEFVRNEAMDARNFFNRSPRPQSTFKRNQFGGSLGGPILHGRTFFYFSYEGLRQRQGIPLNSGVLTDAQRTQALAVNNPAVVQLLTLIPPANDATGTRFLGSATAPVNIDQWTLDVSHTLSSSDRLHGYYAFQRDLRREPTLQGNTIPEFGDTRAAHRQIFTLVETHVFSPRLVNEARLGFNRILITFDPNAKLDPTAFNINDGVTGPVGIPQIALRDIGLNFGGPAGFAQGRGDVTAVVNDTVSYLRGRHSFKFGGEFRRFNNNNFNADTGSLVFNTTTNFINGSANTFAITPGTRPSRIFQSAISWFVQDNWKVRRNVMLELGLRYDWNGTPVEARDRFVVFDPSTVSLVQVGTDGLDKVYSQNTHNFQPRVGIAWDLWGDGKTVLRSGYGIYYDQPVTNMVTGLASNPPFASPLSFNGPGTVPITNPSGTGATTLSPATVNRDFQNAYVQSWNLNVQHEFTDTLAVMIGYFGSKGTHLRLSRNLNQPVGGVRPFTTLAGSIAAGTTLGNIADVDSAGNANYNALWVSVNKRLSHHLQFNTSYTWSKSLDYNSLNSQGVVLQDSNNPRDNYGLSDFDVRHRWVLNGIYDLPFKGNRVIEGWSFSTILQLQTGNPISVATLSTFNGIAGTVRPDLLAPVPTGFELAANGNVQYFPADSACTVATPTCFFLIPSGRFGTMGRNSVIGPGFETWDFSLSKTTRITERVRVQFRADAFDLLNHPNFGQPSRFTSTAAGNTFGQISSTRFPPGDSGSARQLQLALKLQF